MKAEACPYCPALEAQQKRSPNDLWSKTAQDCHPFLDLYSIHADLQFSLEILALRYYEIFCEASMLTLWHFNCFSCPDYRGFLVVFLRFF